MARCRATHLGREPKPDPHSRRFYLLSLDGGGVRGLSSLYVLKGLMVRLNDQRQSIGLARVKPCEVFDLIGGTGTGGIIAIMLGRLEMEMDACIAAYSELMKAMFKEQSSRLSIKWLLVGGLAAGWLLVRWLPIGWLLVLWLLVCWSGKVKGRFDSAKLRSAVNHVVASSGVSPEDPFNDGKDQRCRTFVCATAKETRGVTRLRSYTLGFDDNIQPTISEAALATSAAIGFFEPVTIGARQLVGGELWVNNPVEEVENEALQLWCPHTGNLKPLVKCFVSIGTGYPKKKALKDNIWKGMFGFATETEGTETEETETEETERRFSGRWSNRDEDTRYFRFNVDQGLQDVGFAEYREQGKMEAVTYEYLAHMVQKQRMRDCVENLQ